MQLISIKEEDFAATIDDGYPYNTDMNKLAKIIIAIIALTIIATALKNYIHIPNLPKCDGAIYVVGDSMYPLLKSGDIVLYKQLNSLNDVFWGDMYLLSIDIDGEEYVTVKYIQKSEKEGCIKLVSQNPHHADKDVEMGRVRALALVKASIRMNSMR